MKFCILYFVFSRILLLNCSYTCRAKFTSCLHLSKFLRPLSKFFLAVERLSVTVDSCLELAASGTR